MGQNKCMCCEWSGLSQGCVNRSHFDMKRNTITGSLERHIFPHPPYLRVKRHRAFREFTLSGPHCGRQRVQTHMRLSHLFDGLIALDGLHWSLPLEQTPGTPPAATAPLAVKHTDRPPSEPLYFITHSMKTIISRPLPRQGSEHREKLADKQKKPQCGLNHCHSRRVENKRMA